MYQVWTLAPLVGMMHAMSQPLPPAPGWYPANVAGQERWWDGYRWTPALRPVPLVVVPREKPAKVKYVSYGKKQTSHTFHLIMTVLTCGLWLLVWIPMVIIHAMQREKTVTKQR